MIHSRATVSPRAAVADGTRIGRGSVIEDFAWIGPGVTIGEDVRVLPHAVVGREPRATAGIARQPAFRPGVTVGDASVVGCGAVLYQDVDLGRAVLVGDQAVLREGCRVGPGAVIGTAAQLQYGVRGGADAKVMGGAILAGGSTVGDGAFVAMGVLTSNDPGLPARMAREGYRWDPDAAAGVEIGPGAFVGTGANLLPGTRVGRGGVAAAHALVAHDIGLAERVMGPQALPVPARPVPDLVPTAAAERGPVVASLYFRHPDYEPQPADYPALLRALDRTCARFGLAHTVITDAATVPALAGLDTWAGTLPADARDLMRGCVALWLQYLRQGAPAASDVVLVGADCLVARDPRPVFDGSFDIALTTRGGGGPSTLNNGTVWCPAAGRAHQVALYERALAGCRTHWGADQEAIAQAAAPVPAGFGVALRHGARVAFLPVKSFNHAPAKPDEPTDAVVLHFKGTRKGWMLPWAERICGPDAPRAGRAA